MWEFQLPVHPASRPSQKRASTSHLLDGFSSCSIHGGPQNMGFVNQMAANSDTVNTGCKTEEGSVVQARFVWSTLLFVAV